MQPLRMIAVAAACGLLAACASGPQPTEQLARAHTLVEQAEKSQAQRYAAADLQRARDELQLADAANSKRDYDAARMDAESAGVDADLASARASEGEARRAANEARQSNAVLEHEEQNPNGSGVRQQDLEQYPPASQSPATASPGSAAPAQAPPAQPPPDPDQSAPPRQPPGQDNQSPGAAT
jgi:hypothetical protein